ncbi:phage regulatory CII family protein [Allomesorhizobium camelthorni]|uniref:Uncharacterized protein n=1 Tax=Allomesorhizobium camelthorni TaxID=475069 RepID=A0A6G4W8J8_9HYPH|nr:phage regulatory CII family protein [Mesorhizobium camelthorni]NGO50467.1 hypothetical protein [Mesorhizobium camelthorni]
MKLPRPTSDSERMELKASTRRALDMACAAKFAMITRVLPPALSNYGNPGIPDSFMPIDVVVDLCRDIGSPLILADMAAQLGYRLVPLEPEEGEPIGYEDIARVSKEGGDVVTSLAHALADGKVDLAEKREVRSQIAENIAVLHRLDRKVAVA